MLAEIIFVLSFIINLLLVAISGFYFSRVTVPKLEQRIFNNEHDSLCPWDQGIGSKGIFIAYAIIFPTGKLNAPNNPLINVPLVKSHSTKQDFWVSVVYLTALFTFVFSVVGYGVILKHY